jgi:hypothetical protein
VDYHLNPTSTVAAWLFRPEPESKITAYRQLDSHSARYRSRTRHIEAPWGGVNPSHFASLRSIKHSHDRETGALEDHLAQEPSV